MTHPIAAVIMLAAAAMHWWMFVQESILFPGRPETQRMLDVAPGAVPAVRLWAFQQGVYNFLLGGIGAAGSLLLLAGQAAIGATLLVAVAVSMIAAAGALLAIDRRWQRLPGFAARALPAATALITLLPLWPELAPRMRSAPGQLGARPSSRLPARYARLVIGCGPVCVVLAKGVRLVRDVAGCWLDDGLQCVFTWSARRDRRRVSRRVVSGSVQGCVNIEVVSCFVASAGASCVGPWGVGMC